MGGGKWVQGRREREGDGGEVLDGEETVLGQDTPPRSLCATHKHAHTELQCLRLFEEHNTL